MHIVGIMLSIQIRPNAHEARLRTVALQTIHDAESR